jgi:hypothetical protein
MKKEKNTFSLQNKNKLTKILNHIFIRVFWFLNKLNKSYILKNEIIEIIKDFLVFIITNYLNIGYKFNCKIIKYFCIKHYKINKNIRNRNFLIIKKFMKILKYNK